ncbi:unnamed protein product, partial [Phaeothamnion confervicola]
EALYIADWSKAEWGQVEKDGTAAAQYYKRQPALLNRQRDAEVLGAAAKFLANRSRITKSRNEYYAAIADVHDAIVGDINAAAAPGMRSQLYEAKWKAEAWALAIESYLSSSYTQIGSNISTELEPRALKQPSIAPFPEDADTRQLPRCAGKFEGRKLVYPGSKEYQGMVGSVVAHMETDASGKVTKAEVLAAVPLESFSAQVVDTLKTWTFKPEAGADTSTCRLNSRNHVFKVIFGMG